MEDKRTPRPQLRLTQRTVKYLKPPGEVIFPAPPHRRDVKPDANALIRQPIGTEAMAMQAYMLMRLRTRH